MEKLIGWLRAAGEPTRLRILHILSHGDLTVTELTQILGQSQPRVSRHLKLLCDAGLIERIPEGTWAFFRLTDQRMRTAAAAESPANASRDFVRVLLGFVASDDAGLARDLERLDDIKRTRIERAASYFESNASAWDRLRALHLPEADVEKSILDLVGQGPLGELVDLGTGTGRILELLSGRVDHGIGLDMSREMLAVARANIEKAGLENCHVRQGDIFALPLPEGCADLVTLHQVLHYLSDPHLAVSEAARLLKPGGMLIIVDFAPHELEFLRERHAHRRLGFSEEEVRAWCQDAGLTVDAYRELPPNENEGEQKLTVGIWRARSRARTSAANKLEAAQ